MTDKRITELDAAGALTGDELFEAIQDDDNVKVTAQDVADLAPLPGAGTITETMIADGAITTAKIENNNVTLAKLATQAGYTLLGNPTGSAAAPSAMDVTAIRTMVLPAEEYSGHIEAPIAKTYVLSEYAALAGTINSLRAKLSAGTATVAIKINGTSVTGLSAVAVTTSQSGTNGTAANTVAVGDRITLVVTSPSSAADLTFTVKVTPT